MLAFHGMFTRGDLIATLRGLGEGAFFVQVGAMDGVAHDPLHEVVKELNWSGLLLEPMPDMFARLQKNYAGTPGLTFVNKAIADYEGTISMLRIDPKDVEALGLPDWTLGISTTMADRGMLGGATRNSAVDYETVLKPHMKAVEVPCLRLTTLLEAYKVSKLDCLVIDTEGADWMVARQLPLDRFMPRIVYLEYLHLSPYERVACAQHFLNYGYRIFLEKGVGENFLAIRPEGAA